MRGLEISKTLFTCSLKFRIIIKKSSSTFLAIPFTQKKIIYINKCTFIFLTWRLKRKGMGKKGRELSVFTERE